MQLSLKIDTYSRRRHRWRAVRARHDATLTRSQGEPSGVCSPGPRAKRRRAPGEPREARGDAQGSHERMSQVSQWAGWRGAHGSRAKGPREEASQEANDHEARWPDEPKPPQSTCARRARCRGSYQSVPSLVGGAGGVLARPNPKAAAAASHELARGGGASLCGCFCRLRCLSAAVRQRQE